MRGRLEVIESISYKIMLIKYVRNVMSCELREAKEFVEGKHTFNEITSEQHAQLGMIFGWNYKYQNDKWHDFV